MIRRAFTLVELLVVIAIIGLLSSVAVVATSSTREKARIAAAQSFEAQLDRTLGSYLVGKYDLEEGSGTAVADLSGSGNNGTFAGAPSWSSDTPYASSRYSLGFNGSGNYAYTAGGFGIANSNFTVGLWIKTTGTNGQMYVFANTGDANGYRFGLTTGRVSFLVGGNVDLYTEGACSTQTVNDGRWHHIAGVFAKSSQRFYCYIDGHLAGTVTLNSVCSNMRDGAAVIGSGSYGNAFVGNLDNVRVYASDMSGG